MNSVIEYVLNNHNVSVCIVALNYDQAKNTQYDINTKLINGLNTNMVLSNNIGCIKFQNGSSINFVSNEIRCFRGKSYNLLLFNTNVYERNIDFSLYAEKIGILSY